MKKNLLFLLLLWNFSIISVQAWPMEKSDFDDGRYGTYPRGILKNGSQSSSSNSSTSSSSPRNEDQHEANNNNVLTPLRGTLGGNQPTQENQTVQQENSHPPDTTILNESEENVQTIQTNYNIDDQLEPVQDLLKKAIQSHNPNAPEWEEAKGVIKALKKANDEIICLSQVCNS
jgi:hypothetical protein